MSNPTRHIHPDQLRLGDHCVLYDNLPNDCGLDVLAVDPQLAIQGGTLDAVFGGVHSEHDAESHARLRQQQSGGRFVVVKVVKVAL